MEGEGGEQAFLGFIIVFMLFPLFFFFFHFHPIEFEVATEVSNGVLGNSGLELEVELRARDSRFP